ncbi:50S ribosomal protein L19 [Candidatus Omnitrophota bacterium]
MSKIRAVESKHIKSKITEFSIGDTIRVYLKIVEEDKQRLQAFEGILIGRSGSGIKETIRVRRISYGEGVERIFPLHAPTVEKIDVVRRGKVKRAKLYYLREKVGKKTAVQEKIGPVAKSKA